MKTRFKVQMGGLGVPLLMLAGWSALAGSGALAQAPSNGQQTPTTPANKPRNSQNANPFPDDTNSVPVLPSMDSSAPPPPPDANDSGAAAALPPADSDPVRSPEEAGAAADVGSSSSDSGLDNLLKPPPDEKQGKRGGASEPDQPHAESAKEDESVGSYYLDQKNWKAALSRFESAVVLDPENPDVYWGLAEAQRHVGDFASAKANYQKVLEYDPGSKHSKEAKRVLQDPDIANAKAVSSNASAPAPQH